MSKKNRSKKKNARRAASRSGNQPQKSQTWLILGLLTIAFGVAGYLAWARFQSGSVAGCGPDSGCGDVLSSRWSSWFGVPVSLLALPLYGFLFFAVAGLGTNQKNRRSGTLVVAILAASLMVSLAAVWFTGVQAFIIGEFCPWCLTAHGAGFWASLLVASRFGFFAGDPQMVPPKRMAMVAAGLGAILLVGGQMIYKPDTFDVASLEATPDPEDESNLPRADQLNLHGGRFQLNVSEYPLIGKPDAGNYLLSLFDYTCHHCRATHGKLKALHESFPDDLAIVSLPMPLDRECNAMLRRLGRETHEAHRDACFFARLSLAVFQLKPAEWSDFDDWLLSGGEPPTISVALSRAHELVGDPEAVQQAMASEAAEALIALSVSIYEANLRAKGKGQMPQLVIGNAIVTGEINNLERLYLLVAEQFGLRR